MRSGTPMQRLRDRERVRPAPELLERFEAREIEDAGENALEAKATAQSAAADALEAQTAIDETLDGTREFTGLKIGGKNVKPFLDYTDGSAITNSAALPSGVVQSAAGAGTAGGVASLDGGGKVPESQIPAVAITDTFEVASQAAMLALMAQRGDVAVRSDVNKSFILQATPASTLANWIELRSPTDAVQSVNGQTGVVSLSTNHVGEGGGVLYFTDARARAALSGAGLIIYDSGTGAITVSRQTGWGAPTGTVSRATFDPSTVTLEQLAQRLAALVTDLLADKIPDA